MTLHFHRNEYKLRFCVIDTDQTITAVEPRSLSGLLLNKQIISPAVVKTGSKPVLTHSVSGVLMIHAVIKKIEETPAYQFEPNLIRR
jgi:hypothetical protein